MKNTLYISIIASFFDFAMLVGDGSQKTMDEMEFKQLIRTNLHNLFTGKEFKTDTINRRDFGNARLNNFSSKAVRHFERSFKNISDKQWYILEDGFIAYFRKDGIQMKAAYDESGNWLHTISFYQEKDLSQDMRRLIKREYYDFSIFLVVEIEKDNKMVYIVKMENRDALITVRIWEDEMQEIENYRKSSTKYMSQTCDIQTPASR
jgi:hypothetical protein